MKKIIGLVLIMALSLTLLVGCKEEFVCDACKEEVESNKNVVEMLGQELEVCDDCYEEWEAAQDELEDALGDLEDLDLSGLQ